MTPIRAHVIRIIAEVALFVVIAAVAICLIAAGGLRGSLAGLTGAFATMAVLLGLTLLFRAGRRIYRRHVKRSPRNR